MKSGAAYLTIIVRGDVVMEMAKVTSKGQITIPISIRKRLNVKEGDKLLFLDRAEGVIMVNPDMLRTEPYEDRKAAANSSTAPVNMGEPFVESTNSVASVSYETVGTVMRSEVLDEPTKAAAQSIPQQMTSSLSQVPIPTLLLPEEAANDVEPGAENKKKPGGDIDLSALLDEIRSLNSNI